MTTHLSLKKAVRKRWTRADEETEFAIFERQSSLFWKDSPEVMLIEAEENVTQDQKQESVSNAVREAIAALPEMHQKIIYLLYFEDGADAYSAKDLAAELGIPIRTYYHYLKQAKALLRSLLEAQPIMSEYMNQWQKEEILSPEFR